MRLNVMFIHALPVMFKIQQVNKGMLLFSVTVFCILCITETGMNVLKPFETSTVHLLTNGTSPHQKHRHIKTSWCYNTKSDFKLVCIFLIWLKLYCSMYVCLFTCINGEAKSSL